MMDAHDTHCCIDPSHGCKYGDEDCPVANGIRKQVYQCESCSWNSCEDNPLQQEYIDALWEQKHNPKQLTAVEKVIVEIAIKHGRYNTLAVLNDVIGMNIEEVIEALEMMKWLK